MNHTLSNLLVCAVVISAVSAAAYKVASYRPHESAQAWATGQPEQIQPATMSLPQKWTDPDTGCEYLLYGTAMVPRSSGAGSGIRGCGRLPAPQGPL